MGAAHGNLRTTTLWRESKHQLLFLQRNTAWRLQDRELHSHSCPKATAKYLVNENAWFTACLTWGKEVPTDYFCQEFLCFQQYLQHTGFSIQSSRVFSVYSYKCLKYLKAQWSIFTQGGWMAPLLSTAHVLLFVFPCTQPLELVLNSLNKTPLNTYRGKKKKRSLFK